MVGVILFRAQPFHFSHLEMIKQAYNDCKKIGSKLYIFVGSADKFGTERNPLPINFRLDLILGSLREYFHPSDLKNITVYPLNDLTDESDNSYEWGDWLYNNITKVTHDEDIVIYYSDKPQIILSWFSDETARKIYFKFLGRFDGISATKVCAALLSETASDEYLSTLIPQYVWSKREIIKKYLIFAQNN